MSWIYLIVGSFMEIGWATGVSLSEGFTKPAVIAPTVALLILSFWLFSKSLKDIPVSAAYAIFTGIGSVGTVAMGMIFLGEPFSIVKVVLIAALIGCIIGLKCVSEKPESPEMEKVAGEEGDLSSDVEVIWRGGLIDGGVACAPKDLIDGKASMVEGPPVTEKVPSVKRSRDKEGFAKRTAEEGGAK